MGVTYKLKNEIVEFILRQKHEVPQISCRKLVLAIEENFGLKISKSSINAVIKEAHLSNPVGRPSVDIARTKKFSIPKAKKVQLFGDSFVSSVSEPPDQKNAQISSPKPSSSQEYPPKIQEAATAPLVTKENMDMSGVDDSASAGDNSNEDVSMSVLSAPDEKAKLNDDIIYSAQENLPKLKLDGCAMASFFLWVALREFFQKPVLQEFFKRHTSLAEEEIKIVDTIACFVPHVFDNPDVVFEAQNLWLWKLNGWESPPDRSEIENLIRFLNETKIPKFDYFLETGYFCSMVEHVEIFVSDKKELLLDGRYMFVDSLGERSFVGCPLERSVLETTRFINGNDLAVLQSDFADNFKDVVLGLLACCSGKPEFLIKKIVLVGFNEDSLAEFGHISIKPRGFIVVTLVSDGKFESIFGVPLNFTSENVIMRAGSQHGFVDMNMELKGDGNGREIKHSARILAVDRKDLGVIEIVATNTLMNDCSAKHLMAQVPEFRRVYENEAFSGPESGGMNALFSNEEAEMTIAQAIMTLMAVIVNKLYNDDLFVKTINDNNSMGCIKFYEDRVVVHILPFSESTPKMPAIIEKVLSLCKIETFDGKKVSIKY